MLSRIVLLFSVFIAFATIAHAYSGEGYEVCGLNPNGDNFLALRTGPGASYRMIMKLGPGSVVESRGTPDRNWLIVVVESANGRNYLRNLPTGYVYTKYLCRI